MISMNKKHKNNIVSILLACTLHVVLFSSFIKEALSINGRFGIFALEVSYTKIKEANKIT